ncbi:MAG TPA: serine-type D-Ala-D-Ala carboxypeptidase [Gammaproteobacteria bacterium]|jgi:serine-type D-Ala-D-Ala carboxypeptidase (penicillin-binding protein 5/6)|uniref:serine-type D-Ala-D-Ala carboxypeptidase n=5 Tax=OM182 clade TaxID=745002 RepID=A0A0R2SJ11_9GAMM|nr:MAG: D-alanyl-D-alanine carboxypeptidase [OM182 bacterium BACL3 MAG-120507-bin80]KRO81416.1 MAG: D-alanyl-D-alanine carboxypeptidase [OM182 bacterium BACL3 MAG-120619-bin3]KRO84671.1 MAG: D-alanyl-D-alanine carboxypeptidase [OM182 bacterium BACL3 MAG-120920-bin41]KRP28013.1 MAG: D-alanyl-D-alanine carboxypeptidase [OM182 bacterium BACL3 MAG-120924-bin41]KRP35574.1 MAG: D-alanyl-D-alanine carboxypeptidase [OM182 bacterium BACL3 MAG-121001-bin29]MDP4661907.1 D-alanyl-D-alanine carboxypeptidas
MISRARFNLRTFNLFFALCLGMLPTLRAFAAPAIIPRPPDIAATSYILIDAKTGQVLIQENADEALPPASLTKIMTSYIAIEEIISGRLTLDTPVHISEKAWRMEGSKTFVGVDTMVRAEDLLRGIIIQSGNDASVAIAEHIAGSEEAFADMMNQYAEVMGMQQSFFMNASGLDTELYYNTMSARDLALIARETVIKHKDFYPIYAEREFTYNGITQSNRNSLLFRDRNVDGLKTGWTDAAGFCLVASAERDGMRLISVVMGTASTEARAIETQKLFTYGFRYFETHQLYSEGQVLTNVPVWSGEQSAVDLGVTEDVFVTIPRGQGENLTAAVDVEEAVTAPLVGGQIMGVVNVTLDSDLIYRGDVVAMQAIEQGGLFKRFIDWLTLFFSNLFS